MLVVNTSGTIPAAVDVVADDGTELVVHLSTQLDDRPVGGGTPATGRSVDRAVGGAASHAGPPRAGGATITIEEPYGDRGRLWVAGLHLGERVLTLAGGPRAAHPVRVRPPRLADRDVPERVRHRAGSAEMPSAGRPFTPEVITRLVAKGVAVTPLVLHTGVASLEAGRASLSRTGPGPTVDGRAGQRRPADRPSGGGGGDHGGAGPRDIGGPLTGWPTPMTAGPTSSCHRSTRSGSPTAC